MIYMKSAVQEDYLAIVEAVIKYIDQSDLEKLKRMVEVAKNTEQPGVTLGFLIEEPFGK